MNEPKKKSRRQAQADKVRAKHPVYMGRQTREMSNRQVLKVAEVMELRGKK